MCVYYNSDSYVPTSLSVWNADSNGDSRLKNAWQTLFGTHKLFDYFLKKKRITIFKETVNLIQKGKKKKEGFGVKNKLRFPPQRIV